MTESPFVVPDNRAELAHLLDVLSASQENYRQLFEISPQPTVVLQGRSVVMANPAAFDFFGVDPDTPLDGIDTERFVPSHKVDDVREAMGAMLTGDSAGAEAELSVLLSDGSERPVAIVGRPVPHFGGRAVLATIRDLTPMIEAEQRNAQMREALDSIVSVACATIEMRDPYTAGHQERVAEISVEIAKTMGLSEDEVGRVEIAARLHDLGKVMIPAEILSKPTALTELEYELIKVHPRAAAEILSSVNMGWPVAEVVSQHHERLDGTGYPHGLVGSEISLAARIIGVADVVEAMSSHRPYRPALGLDAAIDEIESWRGVRYDYEVVDACVAVLERDRR